MKEIFELESQDMKEILDVIIVDDDIASDDMTWLQDVL